MVAIQQCVLAASVAACLMAADTITVAQPRFRPDDPLLREVALKRVGDLPVRTIDAMYDFIDQSFVMPRKLALETRVPPAADVNTLGEVPDGSWYTNRHYQHRMSIAELQRGPGNARAPRGTLLVTGAKSDGVTPGFTIKDEAGNRYLLKLDPPDHPELASGADVIGSKIFYALGYHTPENYIVHFRPDSLTIAPGASFRTADGHRLALTVPQIRRLLRRQPRDSQGRCRALASLLLEGRPIGAFKYSGTRSDDPNDVVAHEQRRALRGLAVFAAWINHTDAKATNSLDTVVEEQDRRYVRHHLIDFGSSLGSDSLAPKAASRGRVYEIEPRDVLRQSLAFGFYAPDWQRSRTPRLRGVGRFEATSFHPRQWKSNYPNPAFLRLTEADAFWAARQVAAFTDDELRAIVATAEFSDERAADYLTKVLSARRDRIVAAYLADRLAVDHFRVIGGKLLFDDLRANRGRAYRIAWAAYDNRTGATQSWSDEGGPAVPTSASRLAEGEYCVATLRDPALVDERVEVYLRRTVADWQIVGIDRRFAGDQE